jgi:hypothetical protein
MCDGGAGAAWSTGLSTWSEQQPAAAMRLAEVTQLRLAAHKKAEIKTSRGALSVVYVINGKALTRAADQLQRQIQSTDQAETDKPVSTLQSGLGEIVEVVIE